MKIDEVINQANGSVMCRLIKDASFDEWLTYLFDRPECGYSEHWSFGSEEPEWDAASELSAEYIARMFEDTAYWMRRFSKAQIAAGLEYTWTSAFGNVGSVLKDEGVPWSLQRRAIQSLIPLYEECFSKLCSSGLSHLNESSDNPLNGTCYMYWDVCPFYGQPENCEQHEADEECLRVMSATLQIDHDACRESALHGLGHWALSYPSRANSIIETWLKTKKNSLRRELLEYAQKAKFGDVQ